MALRTDDIDSTAVADRSAPRSARRRATGVTGTQEKANVRSAGRAFVRTGRAAGISMPARRPTARAAEAGSALDLLPAPRAVRDGLYRRTVKRALDLLFVLTIAPFVALIVGPLALMVAAGGGRPFYSQDRVGAGGRVYRIWKLRTMVPDADARLEAHLRENPAARAEWNVKQKLIDDPRITPLGRILRKTSLDELPQLWNVAKGDMSLVGPRPMMVSQQPLYPGRDYYQLRPGVTGLWQISDRNASTFADRAKFDTVYNRTLSMGLDLGILLSTVRVVLRGTGH